MTRWRILAAAAIVVVALAFTPLVRYKPMGLMKGSIGIVVWDRVGARACSMFTVSENKDQPIRSKVCGPAWWDKALGLEARRERERRKRKAAALHQEQLDFCRRLLARLFEEPVSPRVSDSSPRPFEAAVAKLKRNQHPDDSRVEWCRREVLGLLDAPEPVSR